MKPTRHAALVSVVALLTVLIGGVAPARAAAPDADEPTANEPTANEPTANEPTANEKVTVRLMTHDSFAVSKSVLRAFTKQTGITVEVLRSGDAGAALNQAILTKDDPVADAFFGVDTTFLGRALEAGIFVEHRPEALVDVPGEYQLDRSGRLTPIDRGDVCINYDKQWFRQHDLAVPTTLPDLTDPRYEDLLVVENPATSSPGLSFLMATVAAFGEDGWREWWSALRDNGVEVVEGWDTAYNGEFTQGGGGGDRPLVVSYASSPPAAVYYSDPRPKRSPIGTMLASCFGQVELAGVLRNAEHPAAARRLIDFMLSEQFQRDIPLQMFVFPVRTGTPLPSLFERFAEVAEDPLTLPTAQIEQHRETWIQQWTSTVLR